jgi:hypothetical protein
MEADESVARHVCGSCGKSFAYSSGLSKHKRKCGATTHTVAEEAQLVDLAAPPLPLEPELAAQDDTRKEACIKAMDSMIAACPAAGILRKCTLESSYAAVVREHGQVQKAVADYMNTAVFQRLLLTGCGGLEHLSQLPPVKARCDLTGFTEAVARDPTIAENMKLLIAQYPDITKLLTPEAKLAISLLTTAVAVAANNASKKSSSHGGPSHGGARESST